MKKALFSSLLVILLGAIALAHDPRTVSKDFSHTLTLEGAGKLTLSYKSLHYNDTNFNARKGPALVQFNRLWKAIGKFDTDFAVVIAGVQVPSTAPLPASSTVTPVSVTLPVFAAVIA